MIANPVAAAAFAVARAAFDADYPECRAALAFVVDIAERRFATASEGKMTDPRYAAEAPAFARLALLDACLAWERSR